MRALTRQPVLLAIAGLALLAVVWLWGMGGAERVGAAAAAGQRDVQNAMAGALRRLQAGDWAALLTLWGLCFAYGFFHAAGPGHGKLVIGGYGLGRRVPMGRLAGLAVTSSLAQAVTAVLLVYAGVLVLGWSRERMQGLADAGLQALSMGLIALIGLWLMLRGLRGLWRLWSAGAVPATPEEAPEAAEPAPLTLQTATVLPAASGSLYALGRADAMVLPAGEGQGAGQGGALAASTPAPDHAHSGSPGEVCATCGHAHGPSLEQVEAVRSWRDAALIIAAIAVRPCTGALFLLVLTWRLGIDWAGVVGAFVMALGTASVTVLVAVASVSLRESALMQLASGPATARAMALFEALAGALVLILSLQLMLRAL